MKVFLKINFLVIMNFKMLMLKSYALNFKFFLNILVYLKKKENISQCSLNLIVFFPKKITNSNYIFCFRRVSFEGYVNLN